MTRHLRFEIEKLKKKILALSAAVETSVQLAVRSAVDADTKLANKVIDGDLEVDKAEVDLEEDCLKILALHQPVAIDLRFIIAVLKINNDLERIGDEAVNIAERAKYLVDQKKIDLPVNLADMAAKVQHMLRVSLDSLVELDSGLAQGVRELDNEIDKMHYDINQHVKEELCVQSQHMNTLIHIMAVSRHLERIADHATNIAEDVIYMIEGVIARHRPINFDEENGND